MHFRKSVALKQTEMAKSLGISTRTYQNYERGEREISATALLNLYNEFRLDPVWLLSGGNDEPVLYRGQIDVELMSFVIATIEKLSGEDTTLTTEKRARLICFKGLSLLIRTRKMW